VRKGRRCCRLSLINYLARAGAVSLADAVPHALRVNILAGVTAQPVRAARTMANATTVKPIEIIESREFRAVMLVPFPFGQRFTGTTATGRQGGLPKWAPKTVSRFHV